MAGFLVGIGKAGDVAERSPAVISANLKEDMLLRKKVVVLDRSERSVVHQIKVDQKVLYKRFQSRLVRSRLGFARIMGQKDIEKELRDKNIGKLNTDIVGISEEDYMFLEKLENRPCTVSSFSPRICRPRNTKPNLTLPINATLGRSPARSLSASARTCLNSTEVRNGDNAIDVEKTQNDEIHKLSLRPATTMGTRVNGEFLRHQRERKGVKSKNTIHSSVKNSISAKVPDRKVARTPSVIDIENESSRTSGSHSKDHISVATSDENETETGNEDEDVGTDIVQTEQKPGVSFLDELDSSNIRPTTVAMMSTTEDSPPISPKQLSRRASRAAFFEEEKSIDLIELRLREAKSKDYQDKVEQFCSDLEEMKGAHNMPNIDYYASRLENSVKQALTKTTQSVPGTPDDENKRAMGNVYIRSLTVPAIDWNF